MKNEAKRYGRYALLDFAALFAAGIALLWLFDSVWNGAMLNFLNALVTGFDGTGPVRFDTQRLRVYAAILVSLLSAAQYAAPAACARIGRTRGSTRFGKRRTPPWRKRKAKWSGRFSAKTI